MERIDSRGCDYEMDRDLTIDIMQKILHSFDGRVGEDIIISSWPKAKNSDISHNKDEISDFKEIVTSIRTIRSELNLSLIHI